MNYLKFALHVLQISGKFFKSIVALTSVDVFMLAKKLSFDAVLNYALNNERNHCGASKRRKKVCMQ